jgi:hypothetical protein
MIEQNQYKSRKNVKIKKTPNIKIQSRKKLSLTTAKT